jgi:uncharacterized protein
LPINWPGVSTSLDAQGWAILPKLLTVEECDATAGLYGDGEGFRSHVIMARHGFGRGEYRYFSYPLPCLVQALRTGGVAGGLQSLTARRSERCNKREATVESSP